MGKKAPANDLNELFLETWWRVSRYFGVEYEDPRALESLTVGQLRILRALLSGPVTMTGVAQVAGVARGAATGMVDRLVARNLVRRYNDPANRRVVKVELMPDGARLREQVHARSVRRTEMLTSQLSAPQRQELERLLESIKEIVSRDPSVRFV
ncbi:MAG: winged helix-turn-helix transcriptional regulator [Chloroflexi bacterium]|nr:winged helix-turn-helix transcriptional regulator [Chloroflexota bacterium]